MKNKQRLIKFRGGVRIGAIVSTWPNGMLEIDSDKIVLKDIGLKRELIFLKGEIERIVVKKVFPYISYEVRFYSKNNEFNDYYSFGYWSFRFDKLLDALKSLGYGSLLRTK